MAMTFSTSSDTGLVRRTNEDALFARPPVFVVADGMGGAQAGEVASGMAAKAFEYFLPQSSQPEEELSKLIARTNVSIYEYAQGDSGRTGMGTTITAAVVKGGSVSIAHVGDSRAWLLREGSLSRLTQDHSLVAELVREGQLTEEEAAEHPQRSVITRALGVDAEVEIDTYVVPWQSGDVFLLASDGLYSMVSEDEIARLLIESSDLQSAGLALVQAANASGGADNITVVLFCPDGSVPGTAGLGGPVDAAGAGGAAEPGGDEALAEVAEPRPRVFHRLRAFASTVPGNILIGILLMAALTGGAWFGTRFVYYVGVEGQNVVIYRGVPYALGPVTFSELHRASEIRVDTLEEFEQKRVLEGNLQTQGSAEQMLDNLIIADRRKKEEEQRALREERDASER